MRVMNATEAEQEIVKLSQQFTERAHELGIHVAVFVKVSDGVISDAYGSAEGLAAGIAALTEHVAKCAKVPVPQFRLAIGAYHSMIDLTNQESAAKPS